MSTRAYRAPRRPSGASVKTKAAILAAVRDLLAEGAFHETTLEDVATRAGVSRATLYQHFGSRTGLVDALCETFDATPALLRLRSDVLLDDPGEALDATIADVVEFWAGEEAVLVPLYGVAAIDPAAADLVQRQFNDRSSEMRRLAARLRASGKLRPEMTERALVAQILLMTSFETFQELRRRAGLPLREVTRVLQESGRTLLLAG